MLFVRFIKYLPLLLFIPLAWLLSPAPNSPPEAVSPEKVNLALRRTAHGLLRAAGDSTSRIPAVEQAGARLWRVRIDRPFLYEELPPLLQASLDLHGVRQSYEVTVRRCADATIDLGYHQLDFLQNNSVPCQGRAAPAGCHYIEIAFVEGSGNAPFKAVAAGFLFLLTGGLTGGFWWYRRRKKAAPAGEPDWLIFGRSRLDVAGQLLLCGGVRRELTFRETKLLRLFATHPDRLLEREYILREVWADEGVLVSRSVDVFVSRLRKKLAADPSVGIVAVHGVGYRLETGLT